MRVSPAQVPFFHTKKCEQGHLFVRKSVWNCIFEIREHVIMKKQTLAGDIGCVVPLHKEVALGTLKGILKQASVSPEEFFKVL